MTRDRRDPRLARLEPLVGQWRMEAPAFPLDPALAGEARTTFEWALGGAFLLERSSIPVPEAPDGLIVIAPDSDPDGDGYTQHYFDSRGVVRIYAMTFDGRAWTLERRSPDFSPLSFHQRWTSTLSDDGREIAGRWETSPDGSAWELDFELTYVRLDG
jgi:hypothetical protein